MAGRRVKNASAQTQVDKLLVEKAIEFFDEECEDRWQDLYESIQTPGSHTAFERLKLSTDPDGQATVCTKDKQKVVTVSVLIEKRVQFLRAEYEKQLQALRTEIAELTGRLETLGAWNATDNDALGQRIKAAEEACSLAQAAPLARGSRTCSTTSVSDAEVQQQGTNTGDHRQDAASDAGHEFNSLDREADDLQDKTKNLDSCQQPILTHSCLQSGLQPAVRDSCGNEVHASANVALAPPQQMTTPSNSSTRESASFVPDQLSLCTNISSAVAHKDSARMTQCENRFDTTKCTQAQQGMLETASVCSAGNPIMQTSSLSEHEACAAAESKHLTLPCPRCEDSQVTSVAGVTKANCPASRMDDQGTSTLVKKLKHWAPTPESSQNAQLAELSEMLAVMQKKMREMHKVISKVHERAPQGSILEKESIGLLDRIACLDVKHQTNMSGTDLTSTSRTERVLSEPAANLRISENSTRQDSVHGDLLQGVASSKTSSVGGTYSHGLNGNLHSGSSHSSRNGGSGGGGGGSGGGGSRNCLSGPLLPPLPAPELNLRRPPRPTRIAVPREGSASRQDGMSEWCTPRRGRSPASHEAGARVASASCPRRGSSSHRDATSTCSTRSAVTAATTTPTFEYIEGCWTAQLPAESSKCAMPSSTPAQGLALPPLRMAPHATFQDILTDESLPSGRGSQFEDQDTGVLVRLLSKTGLTTFSDLNIDTATCSSKDVGYSKSDLQCYSPRLRERRSNSSEARAPCSRTLAVWGKSLPEQMPLA